MTEIYGLWPSKTATAPGHAQCQTQQKTTPRTRGDTDTSAACPAVRAAWPSSLTTTHRVVLCKSEGVVFQECSIQSVEGRYGWWPSQAHLALRLAPKDWFRSSLSSMMSSLSWIWWLGNLGVGFLLAHVSHCLPQSLHSAIEQDLLIAASEFQLHSSVWQVLICFQDFPRTISKLKDSRVRRAPCLGALFTKKNWFSARM